MMPRSFANVVPGLIVGAVLALSSGVTMAQGSAACVAPGPAPTNPAGAKPVQPSDVPSSCWTAHPGPECSKFATEITAYKQAEDRWLNMSSDYAAQQRQWQALQSKYQSCLTAAAASTMPTIPGPAACTSPGSPPAYSVPDKPLQPAGVPSSCWSARPDPQCSQFGAQVSGYKQANNDYLNKLNAYSRSLDGWRDAVTAYQSCEASKRNLPSAAAPG